MPINLFPYCDHSKFPLLFCEMYFWRFVRSFWTSFERWWIAREFWIVFSVLSHSPESILLELFFAKARGLPSLFQCYNSVLCLHLRKICSSAVFPMYCDKFADYNSIHNVQWYCNPNFSSTVFCQNLIIYKSSLVTFWSCSDFQNAHMINNNEKNNTPRVSLGLWDLSGGVRFRCESTTPFVLCKRFV